MVSAISASQPCNTENVQVAMLVRRLDKILKSFNSFLPYWKKSAARLNLNESGKSSIRVLGVSRMMHVEPMHKHKVVVFVVE